MEHDFNRPRYLYVRKKYVAKPLPTLKTWGTSQVLHVVPISAVIFSSYTNTPRRHRLRTALALAPSSPFGHILHLRVRVTLQPSAPQLLPSNPLKVPKLTL